MRPLACIAAGMLWAVSVLAFANVPVGAQIENVSLPSFAGGEQSLISDTNVSVFIFINPELEHSNHALAEISLCARAMTNKPVHWCAVVSDRVPRAVIEAEVKSLQLTMPVLIDRGNALFGKLGVVMRPSIGITDEHRTLIAYEHFTKVNYGAVVKARVRHALKEIPDDELAEVLHPPAATLDKTNSVANRYFRLASRQFAATNYVQALTSVQKSLDQKPTAAAYLLQGNILAAQGKTNEAATAFAAAQKLGASPPSATAP
jgi:tetratricopeptide (TPR) repeat protein